MTEARQILQDACMVPDIADRLISMRRLNDFVDLYQFNHLIKNNERSQAELVKIIEESRKSFDTFDAS